MKALTFAIQKGGQGKSSLSGNVSYLLSKHVKTLAIDGDPQGSLSSWLITESPKYELADVLQGKASLREALVQLNENLSILPTFGVGGSLRHYGETELEREPFIFEDLNTEMSKLGFAVAVYDTGPSTSRLERCILLGSSEVIVPLSPEYLSVDGIEIFEDFLQSIEKGFKRKVRHGKIVINLLNKRFSRHGIYADRIKRLSEGKGYRVYEVGQDASIPESQTVHVSLPQYNPHSRVIPELERLAKDLLDGRK